MPAGKAFWWAWRWVVFDAPIRRRLLPMGRAAYVNETGIPKFDALCIEHNGFLLDVRCRASVQQAMFDRLCDAGSSWREVHLRQADAGADTLASCPELKQPQGARTDRSKGLYRRSESRDGCLVNLQRVRERAGDYVGLLRAGRRAHIRRCLRAYAAVGPLRLTEAQDVPTALVYLDRLVALHDLRWAGRGAASGFSAPYCRAFHEQLVRDAWPRGEVQLLRVTAGTQELGYLYSFVHAGRVCFYQSGYDYQLLDPKHSPGLVTLVLAIQHNAAKGMAVFDFLAGNQAYKASLATDRTAMVDWTVQRRSVLSATEMALRWHLRLARGAWRRLRSMGTPRRLSAVAAVFCLGALAAAAAEYLDFETGEVLRVREVSAAAA